VVDTLKIGWITAELTPYVKIGGLADVSAALPKALDRLNQDIRIILPKYSSIDQSYDFENLDISFPDFRGDICNLYRTKLPNSNVIVYLLDHPLFEGDAYDHDDLGLRFSTFSWLASRVFDQINWHPDIIHANDWHTALIVPLLQKIPVKTIFTIHNLAYQGRESAAHAREIGLDLIIDPEVDEVNYMQLGIQYADKVTTVSSTYAKEILTEEYGFGLQNNLRKHPAEVEGIVHGIDTDEYDTLHDQYLTQNYSVDTIEQKSVNKIALQEKARLPPSSDQFLIGVVSRLVGQKGMDLLVEIIPQLVEKNIQVIVLGTGEDDLEKELQRLQYAFSENVHAFLTYNVKLSHMIFAGVDGFIVPSKYEPCGLTQLYAMTYGTVPIVRRTGGLADTVIESGEKATGFLFDEFNSEALLAAILRAQAVYLTDKPEWLKLQQNGMRSDLSWDKPAKLWLDLYHRIL